MSQLADICQVVYFDHRGHGRSDLSTPEHWNLDQWADDLVGLCAALEIEKPIVMGVSFGGNVAIAYATKYPAHPAKLILGSTRAATANFEISLAVFERLGGAEAREVAQRYFDDPGSEHFKDFVRVCIPLYNRAPRDHEEGQRVIRTDEVAATFPARRVPYAWTICSDLARVQCPALVFGGEDDPMVPIEFQADIAAALPATPGAVPSRAQCGPRPHARRSDGVRLDSRVHHGGSGSVRVEVNGVRIFFDVEGAKLVPDGPVCARSRR